VADGDAGGWFGESWRVGGCHGQNSG
jgi:hypothetical protein